MAKLSDLVLFSVKIFLVFSILNCVCDDKIVSLNNWYENTKLHEDSYKEDPKVSNSAFVKKISKRNVRVPHFPKPPYLNRQSGQYAMEDLQESASSWNRDSFGWGWTPSPTPYGWNQHQYKDVEDSEHELLLGLLGIKGLKIIKVLKSIFGFGLALKCLIASFIAFKVGLLLSPVVLPFLAPMYLGSLLLPFVPLLVLYLIGSIFTVNANNATTTTTTTTMRSQGGRSLNFKRGDTDTIIPLTDRILASEKCVDKIVCAILFRENRY